MPIDSAVFDIETLGTTANAVILSVGAIAVDSSQDYTYDELIENGFYVTLDVKSQVDAGRSIEKDTLEWWGKQGNDAMKVLTPSKDDIPWDQLVNKIFDYFQKVGANPASIKVYSRGSHFDFGIMHDLFRVTGDRTPYNLPWKWWNIHDSKTVIETLLGQGLDVQPEGFIHHNALHDSAREYMNIQTAIYKFQESLEESD
jgi:exodeoxyribonuclease VIII